MPEQFSHGFGLLIGVDENAVPAYALPDVAKDVAALQAVLTHPERCAYAPDHVRVLTGQTATRQGILDGLVWLAEQIARDGSGLATVVVYYSGHGWRSDYVDPPAHFLIPFDMRPGPIPLQALRAEDFAAGIEGLDPRGLLVILDCCHSGGMRVKGQVSAGGDFVPAAAPLTMLGRGRPGIAAAEGAKGLETLSLGAGRALLSSSQGTQPSYIRRDRTMSIFTYHVIEALTGHARPAEGAKEVLVSDIMGHVWRRVPESAKADCGEEQQPDYQVTGNFPVALLLGGKGISKGQPIPDPLAPLPAAASTWAQTVTIGSGDYVQAGNVVHGDEVLGDQVAGDVIKVGSISNSTVAIGRGATITTTTGLSGADLDHLFAPVLEAARSAAPGARDGAIRKAEELKAEVAKGNDADDNRIGKLIDGLIALVPNAVSVVMAAFGSPILAGVSGPVTRFVLDRIQGK